MNRTVTILLAAAAFAVLIGHVTRPAIGQGSETLSGLNKKIEIARGLDERERECIECHAEQDPGRVNGWLSSAHAGANITCIDCHEALRTDKDARDCPGTEKYGDLMITPVVTPDDCGRCHPQERRQFGISKHARTWEIMADGIRDSWLKGMNNEVERATGCYMCHGSDVSTGELTWENWPNEGCGRLNPDGSAGSCVICHTAHMWDLTEARKPENCGQCHLGPDHPQEEIYFESKHGKRYQASGHEWNWESAPDAWEPSSDYTAPTCAACHMSGIGPLSTTHDVGERLKWEAQAPLTIENKDHDGDDAREKMLTVCTQCHSPRWSENYLVRYDKAIENYNELYFKPVKKEMDSLYRDGILTEWPMFDEELEWIYYEYWHHEGRRARMGSAMMGPDYSWWHGFYDLKHSYRKFITAANEAREKGHGDPVYVPGSGGDNLTSDDVTPVEDTWDDIEHLEGK